MTDFLLELRSEEIPARMQAKARDDLARLFAAELAKAGIVAGETTTYATPRRLALIARDLPDATEPVSEEIKGPKTAAPPQALEGFLRKTGLTRDQLTERDGILFAVTQQPGRATADVLADAIPAIVRGFPWPKSMRWGTASTSTESPRWVRPLQGIVALFGDDIVPCEIAGIASGAATLGHRFHHPGVITIGSAHDYVEKLRACHVIVDQDERMALIRDRAQALAAEAGLVLVEDEGLVAENAGLTEWPVPLLGRFDEAYLDVPAEVIQLTARVNQKYFVLRNPPPRGEGDRSAQPGGGGGMLGDTLANAFICTANIDATDGGATILEGNRKVLAARLSDAKFFYDTDLKVPLEDQARKLEKIVFHEKLGTVADKVERVAKLARWLVEEGIVSPLPPGEGQGASAPRGEGERNTAGVGHPHPSAASPLPPSPDGRAMLAERAAHLAKADLVTGMVGEFPELQGLMGGYYAAAQGEDPAVAKAIRDHYKPVGQGDDVPTAPVTVAVSLADKLDTIFSFAAADMMPTGSSDPYAIRRSAIACLNTLNKNGLRLELRKALKPWYHSLASMHLGTGDEMLFVAFMSTLSVYDGPHRTDVMTLHDPDTPRADWFQCNILSIEPDSLPYEEPLTSEDLAVGWVDWYKSPAEISTRLEAFFADRLKVQQREAGVRHDLIDAVFALGGEDDLVRLLARVRALQAFVGTEDGANLLAGYKRAANILKKEGWTQTPLPPEEGQGAPAPRGEGEGGTPDASHPHPSAAFGGSLPLPEGEGSALSYTPELCEAALIAALDSAEPAAASAVAREDFEGAMAALATLRAPIDAFFDTVTVNDPDAAKREARLQLLARVRAAVHGVADFSRIEG